jgi:hypothetical protein
MWIAAIVDQPGDVVEWNASGTASWASPQLPVLLNARR